MAGDKNSRSNAPDRQKGDPLEASQDTEVEGEVARGLVALKNDSDDEDDDDDDDDESSSSGSDITIDIELEKAKEDAEKAIRNYF